MHRKPEGVNCTLSQDKISYSVIINNSKIKVALLCGSPPNSDLEIGAASIM